MKQMYGPIQERRVLVYDAGTMGNLHLKRSSLFVFIVYCISFLVKKSGKTEQNQGSGLLQELVFSSFSDNKSSQNFQGTYVHMGLGDSQ